VNNAPISIKITFLQSCTSEESVGVLIIANFSNEGSLKESKGFGHQTITTSALRRNV
jgi:hypothetical protein